MTSARLRPATALASFALPAVAVALVWSAVTADRALAEACAGSGSGQCPYATAQIIGQRAERVLRFPEAVAVDTVGDVYVADQLGYVVQKFTAAGAFVTEWGSFGGGHGQFGPIGGLATDAAGNVYVVDSSHNRIQKFDANGAFITAWGHSGSELGQFSFGSSQDYTKPPGGGIAVAGNYVYVADSGNNRIERFALDGSEAMQWGTMGSEPGQFSYPRGVAANATEVLVADDDNNRIEKFDPNGAFQFAGAWTTAGGHSLGFGAPAGPAGIGIDPRGSVYVADLGHERLVRLWGDGTFLSELGGPAIIGGAQLSGAGGVAVAADTGKTYVADSGHNRVLVYGPDGVLLAKWGAGGGDGSSGGEAGQFNHPGAVAVAGAGAGQGNVYVADRGNDRVVELSQAGSVLRQWGARGTSDGRFHGPAGVAVDGAGDVYVVDGENNRVQVFDPNGRFVEKWGLRGIGLGELSQPTAVAVDCAGDVYVADTNNNRVERFNIAAPAATGCLAPGAWPPPLDVAPVLHVSLPRHSGVLARRALALTVSCQRGCKVLANATLAPRGRRGAVKLIAAARALPRAQPGHVRLRVGPAALRRLLKALGRRAAMTANVRIVAAGPTGRRTTVTRTFVVQR